MIQYVEITSASPAAIRFRFQCLIAYHFMYAMGRSLHDSLVVPTRTRLSPFPSPREETAGMGPSVGPVPPSPPTSSIIRRNGETLGRFGFSTRRRDLHSASQHLGTSELSAGLCKAVAIQYKNTERLRAIFSGPF